LQTLPKLPDAALQQFRKDLPADDADVARALSTRAAWDPVGSNAEKGQQAASKTELASLVGARDEADTWAAVDERTMDPHYFLRMRRQSIQQAGVRSAGGATPPVTTMSGQLTAVGARAPFRRCRLSDRRGRVSVDYREAGTLSEFLNVHGKIMHRRKTGLSAKAQRKVSRAVKTARQMALLHPEPRPGLTVKEMQEMEKALQLQ
jgi:small subunit ribosomal protein S18